MLKRNLIIVLMLLVAMVPAAVMASPLDQQTVAVATVTASMLNVRTAPYADADLIATVNQGYTAGVIGRNLDSSWYQIILPGGSGWVNASYVAVTNAHTVPVTHNSTGNNGGTGGAVYGYVDTGALNIRPIPAPTNNVPITFVYRNTPLTLVGRNADSSWYEVMLNSGVRGWVRSTYIAISQGNPGTLPITNTGTNPTPVPTPPVGQVYATVSVNTGALNIRPLPSPFNNLPITFVYRGTMLNVIGRNANSSWYQVQLGNGNRGWVNSRYVALTSGNPANAPITG